MTRRCNELPDEEVEAALQCCASATDQTTRRLCEDSNRHDCVCSEERGNNTAEYAKFEQCQEGRIKDSITCAVCQPEFMRTRGGCVKCYETETRVVVLVLEIMLLIIMIFIGRRCWKKMYRYRTAWRDVMRIVIIIINIIDSQGIESLTTIS